MTIDVQIGCRDETPRAEQIAAWARAALAGDPRSLCLRIVDDAESAALNARFRNRRHATNVLAFPAGESAGESAGEGKPPASGILGDIAICAPVAAREAWDQRKNLADHYAHLVVHGVLHLLGRDHRTAAEAEIMEAEEIMLLQQFGIDDPYGA